MNYGYGAGQRLHQAAPDSRSPDMDKLIAGANEVAATARTLLTALLAAAVTLAATTLASSDEALLRDSVEVFSELGIRARLSVIYLLAPFIFTFMHINALLQLRLLLKRMDGVEQEMNLLRLDHTDRARWRRMVHGFAFAQVLLGSENHHGEDREERFHRILLMFMSWAAIVIIPLALLICTQVTFVRYQSDSITLVHQLLIFIDLVVLSWFQWIAVSAIVQSRVIEVCYHSLFGLIAVCLLWLSWSQAIPPHADEDMRAVRFGKSTGQHRPLIDYRGGGLLMPLLYAFLLPKEVCWRMPDYCPNLLDRLAFSTGWRWMQRYLDLSKPTQTTLGGKAELLRLFGSNELERSAALRRMAEIDLRGRTLRFADFSHAYLLSADLRNIRAENSNWASAQLNGAQLDGANLQGAALDDTHLQRASLMHAQLQGAKLHAAKLQAADLSEAKLQGAVLKNTKLQGANLYGANFQGAVLRDVDLRGAAMDKVDFKVALMLSVRLNYASGIVGNCTDSIVSPPQSDRDNKDSLIRELEDAGSKKNIIDNIRRFDRAKEYNVLCEGVPIYNWPDFDPKSYINTWRDAVCNDGDVSKGLPEISNNLDLDFHYPLKAKLSAKARCGSTEK